MQTLSDILLADSRRDGVIADCARLFDSHIGSIGGLKGMGIKAAWSLLKSAKPDIPQRAARRILPDLATTLQPFYERFQASGGKDFASFLGQHADEAGRQVLAVAAAKIAASDNGAVKGAWQKFRGVADQEVKPLVPKLGELIGRHL